ncbi:MAG: hypothetical protein ACLR3C_11385 [Eggerthella lenta]
MKSLEYLATRNAGRFDIVERTAAHHVPARAGQRSVQLVRTGSCSRA